MTLTVRLDKPLEQALDAYCAEQGVTKSQVVQECLATYLVNARGVGEAAADRVSPAYAAMKKAGLVGSVRLGSASATRDVVRERMAAKLRRPA